MLAAVILPLQIDDQTVDDVITTALKSGLIACNKKTGPFRISFFQQGRIPAGWAKIGLVDKTRSAPCAA